LSHVAARPRIPLAHPVTAGINFVGVADLHPK
jgi:hypothetical protein